MTTSSLLFIGGLGTPELILILIVVLVLFGGKKIPELMRNLGKGIGEFKKSTKGEDKSEAAKKDEKQPEEK